MLGRLERAPHSVHGRISGTPIRGGARPRAGSARGGAVTEGSRILARVQLPLHSASDLVALDPDHPGFRDAGYRERRNRFGVVEEQGELRAFGAGILSSSGELERFREAPRLAWDLERIAATPYDPTHYQPGYYVAPSCAALLGDTAAWAAARFGGSPRQVAPAR